MADQSRGKDAEIGRAVSEIVSRGNDAEVKRGRDGDIYPCAGSEEEDHKENKGLMNGHKWTAEWCQQIWETVSVGTFFVFGVMLWHSTTAVSESIRQSRQRG